MKGKTKALVGCLLLLGALCGINACGDNNPAGVPAPVTPVAPGVYDFQPPASTIVTGFVNLTILVRGLQQNFPVTPNLYIDPNQGGFQSFPMNFVQSNIYTYTMNNVVTNSDVALNIEDTTFVSGNNNGFLYNQNGLDPAYPDQLVTVSVSVDGGQNWIPISKIQGNDLEFTLDEFGNIVVPRFDVTVTYTPTLTLAVAPDLYFAWYFDPVISQPPFEMVQQGNNWQVSLLGVPAGIFEANLQLNTGPHDIAVDQDSVDGTFSFNGTVVTDVVWYAELGFDPLFPNLSLVQLANLLLRLDQNGGVAGIPGGTVVYIQGP